MQISRHIQHDSLRMRNVSDQILARSGPRMRRISGRYRGGAPNPEGVVPGGILRNSI